MSATSPDKETEATALAQDPVWGVGEIGRWLLLWIIGKYVLSLGVLATPIVGLSPSEILQLIQSDPNAFRQPLEALDPTTSAKAVLAYSFAQAGLGLVLLRRTLLPYESVASRTFVYDFTREALIWGIAGFAMASFGIELARYLEDPSTLMDIAYRALSTQGNFPAFSCYLVSGAVIAPFFEEIIYRGFMQPAFKRVLGLPLGVLATSLVFTVVHASPLHFWPYFIGSCVLGGVYEGSGRNMAAPTLAHSFFNTFCLIQYFVMIQPQPLPLQ
eukprot:CAMPEP_0184652462 /NCGR_PEP_ID=MMETSP0308-20130426/10161_1 /TAXON_ID=38269 /ORGANISM="Gloeochaete witrockiana, Strain SAG 46.84" /LENGTH=271 /DNA_ID=CAMNT_0027087349 /DNA_START=262 /DNA_END=1077 /DNA_ORIENTATION=+